METSAGVNLGRTLVTSLGILLFVQHTTSNPHAVCPAEPIVAVRGDSATLWCRLDPQENLVDSTVDWKTADLDEVLHSYRHKKDHPHLQAERFRGRTAVNHDDLSRGIYTVNISSVQLSDSGSYRCFFPEWTARCDLTLLVVEGDQQDERKRDTTSTTTPPLDNVTKLQNSDGESTRGRVGLIVSVVLTVCLLTGLALRCILIGGYVKTFRWRKEQKPETPFNGLNHSENMV